MAKSDLIEFLTKPLVEDGWEKLPTAFMKNGCLLVFKDSLKEIRPTDFLLRASDIEALKSAPNYNAKLDKMRVNYSSHAKLPNRTFTLEFNRCVVGAGKIATTLTKLPPIRSQNSPLDKFLTNIDSVANDIANTYPDKLIPYRSTYEDIVTPKRNPIDKSKTCEECYYETIGAGIPIVIAYADKNKNYERCLLTIVFKEGKFLGALERQKTGASENLIELKEAEVQQLFTVHYYEKSSKIFYITMDTIEKRTDAWDFNFSKNFTNNISLPQELAGYRIPLHTSTLISSLYYNNKNYGPLLEKNYNTGAAMLVANLVELNEDYHLVPESIDIDSAKVYTELAKEVNIKRFLNPSFNQAKINSMFEQFTANVQKQLENFSVQSNEDIREIRRLASIGVALKDSTVIPGAMRKRAYYFYKTSEFGGLYEPLINRGDNSENSIKCTKDSYGLKAIRLIKDMCNELPNEEFFGSTVRNVLQFILDNLISVTLNKDNELIFNSGVMGFMFQRGYFAILNSVGSRIVSITILDGKLIYDKNKENIDFSFTK